MSDDRPPDWIGYQMGPTRDYHNEIRAERNALREALRVARAALAFFENADNWKREGRCDPNSGNFIGSTHARAALSRIDELTGGEGE